MCSSDLRRNAEGEHNNENGDKSSAATCGVKNKLWVIIASKGKSLASEPGHDQCF